MSDAALKDSQPLLHAVEADICDGIVRGIDEENELVTGIADGCPVFLDCQLQNPADCDQGFISGQMPVGIVDAFEAVDVQHDAGQRGRALPVQPGCDVVEISPVIKTGELVPVNLLILKADGDAGSSYDAAG